MSDLQPNPEQKEQSPQELNNQLKEIFSRIPAHHPAKDLDPLSDDDGEEFDRVIQNRRNSDYLKRLQDRATQLLDQSEITPEFKSTVLRELALHYEVGVPYTEGVQNDPQTYFPSDHRFSFLDPDNPSSGGLFDPKLAERLEQASYLVVQKQATTRYLDLKAMIGRDHPESLKDKAFLDSWKQHFKDTYHKDLAPQ